MKYLTVFQLNNFEAAVGFTSMKDAKAYVEKCALAAKSKSFENSADQSYLIELKTDDDTKELKVSLQPVDTEIKYELSYDKNDEHVETTYHKTRAAMVTKAKSILDNLGYEPSPSESELGNWSVIDEEENLKVTLTGKLVLTSEGDNIVSSYDSVDMVAFCKNPTPILSQLDSTASAETSALMQSARKKGLMNLGIGCGIALLGGILTLISYNNAHPGERYTIFTGFIVVGIIDALCGVYQLINPKSALPKDKRPKK